MISALSLTIERQKYYNYKNRGEIKGNAMVKKKRCTAIAYTQWSDCRYQCFIIARPNNVVLIGKVERSYTPTLSFRSADSLDVSFFSSLKFIIFLLTYYRIRRLVVVDN